MNEVGSKDQSTPLDGSIVQDSLSAGAMLRCARESTGMHIAALAVAMKVPVKKLEALEAGRLDLLPDAVFVRALTSSICRSLKIDPAPILAKLPQNITPRLKSDELGINAPFRSAGHVQGIGLAVHLMKPVVLIVAALVIGAVVLAFIPQNKEAELSLMVSPEPTPSTELSVQDAANSENLGPLTSVAAPGLPIVVSATPMETVGGAKVVEIAVPSSLESDKAVGPLQEAKPVVANSNTVTISARGASWVEVVDAKQNVQIRRTLLAGESAVVSGVTPLSVVIGKVDVIDVEISGKPFSLLGIAKDNVARFEVK